MRRTAIRSAVLVASLGMTASIFWAPGAEASEPRRQPGVVCEGGQPDDGTAVSSARSAERIEAYDVEVVLDESGSATFTETITYTFAGAKHGIFRDIVVRQRCTDDDDRAYPFELLSVDSPSGAPDRFTIEHPSPAGGGLRYVVDGSPITRVKIGDPDLEITGTHVYVVRYRLKGVVNGFDDHEELYWNVIGNGWGVPITNAAITVRGPGAVTGVVCYAGPTGSRAPCDDARIERGAAHFTDGGLAPYEPFTVVAAFPPGTFDDVAPYLRTRWSPGRALRPPAWALAASAALLVAVVGGWSFLAYRVGRDRQVSGSHVDVAFAPVGARGRPVPFFADDVSPVEFVPPEGLRPAQVGLLADEVAHPVDVSATIVDLAVRGYLRIEEIERKWRRDDYLLTRLEKDTSELLGYERLLLGELVSTPGASVKLSDLRNTFASSFRKVVDAIYDDAVERGWFHVRPDRVRRRWKLAGSMLLLASVGLAVVAFLKTQLVVLAVPLVVAGLLSSVGARWMPRRTPAGTGVLRRVRGFEEFIRDSEAPRARWAENNNIFSEYLPFAIVLRCADRWARAFEGLGKEALGTADWYRGESFSPLYVSSAMSSFSASAGTTLSSAPSSSGSGGGGGSSGGGGGGGGGGSW